MSFRLSNGPRVGSSGGVGSFSSTNNYKDPPSDPDGKHARACEIMAENRTLSVRDLSRLLKECGIRRSPEWCRKHRGDAVLPTEPLI